MTSIHLKISGANAVAETSGVLTAGMVGVPVTIEYDSSWDGLVKTFVCRCGGVTKSRIGIESSTTLPHEAMVTGCDLYIGVCGRSPDGAAVVPSIWARCGRVYPSATGNAEESSDPEKPIWAQIQGQIGALDNLETAAKENLVSAINEAFKNSGGPGGAGVVPYTIGAGLKLVDDGTGKTLMVDTADAPEADNTLPITSAAVHATIGNIDALLSII